MLPNSLFDCNTRDDCITYFNINRSSDRTPQLDATFALNKLEITNPFVTADVLLSLSQRINLETLCNTPVVDRDWSEYCNILTVKQIKFVGW